MSLPRQLLIRNRLLQVLTPGALDRLLPQCGLVTLKARQTLYSQDGPIRTVYFLESGMISLISNMVDGLQAEVGMIGREGMLGTSQCLGVETSFVEAVVQLPGTALAMGSREFRHELQLNAPLRQLLLRYSNALQGQIMQTAACNGHHNLEQRLARWLLMAHDRAEDDHMLLTQEFVAMMLAVHRPSLTVAAGILQRAGLIRHVSGRITIVDRTGLEARACECYSRVARQFSTLLPQPA